MSSSKAHDPWVRLFRVSDPCRHKNDYTVYKVTSTVFPRNAPEAATEIVVWKRFNDFKNLFKSLRSLHTNLLLSGVFPSFPRSHVFGRFNPEVIEERRQSALKLLEFVAGHSPLFTSQPFLRFFEGGNVAVKPALEKDPEDGEHANHVLKPVRLYEASESLVAARTAEPDSSVDTDDEDSNGDEVIDPRAEDSSGSLLSLFDPLCRSECSADALSASDVEQSVYGSNWLVAALTSTRSSVDESLTDNNDLLHFPKAFADFEDEATVEQTYGSAPKNSMLERVTSSGTHGSEAAVCVVASLSPLLAMDSVFNDDDDDLNVKRIDENQFRSYSEDYVVLAAEQLKRAQDNESFGNYDAAFALYKMAVGTLLSGVREDLDCDRRVAVKRKTTQYLQRAEEIHERYLAARGRDKSFQLDDPCWDVSSPDDRLLKLPASELGRYKVLGVVDKVLIVSDSVTGSTCVVKIVPKSSVSHRTSQRVALPVTIPHVVSVLRYHETDDAFFLILKHAAGGKLWNYVGSYLQNGAMNSKAERDDSVCGGSASNIYAGKKLLGDDGNAQDSNAKVSPQTETKRVVFGKAESTDSALLDTKELLSKAKRLIENVTETLHESERVCGAVLPQPTSKESTTVCCRKDSDKDSRKRRLKRRPSDDAFFAPGKDGSILRRRASAGSSLELQGTRVRHFSSVFRELDVEGDDNSVRLPESCVQIWAGEIAAALMGLHSSGIVCWDLNPDNVLLDDRGHIIVSYFGCLPGVDVDLDPYAKEMHYVAPELVGISEVGHSCDWWSFGALLFELLTGKTLALCHPGGFSSHTMLNIPCQVSIEAESILKELLCYNPRERLGCGPEGDAAIRTHPFLSSLDWDRLRDSHDKYLNMDEIHD